MFSNNRAYYVEVDQYVTFIGHRSVAVLFWPNLWRRQLL